MRWRWILALCLCSILWTTASAADKLAGVRIDAVYEGATSVGALSAGTLWAAGDRSRLDFDAGPGRRGRILRNGRHAWLLLSSSDRALPADHLRLGALVQLDVRRPCWSLGFACEATGTRRIAGRLAQGWRYRNAGHAGPDGTDVGEFWIDGEHGLLLAYKGNDLGRHTHRMEATRVQVAPIPADTFEPPEALRIEIQQAENRADRLRSRQP